MKENKLLKGILIGLCGLLGAVFVGALVALMMIVTSSTTSADDKTAAFVMIVVVVSLGVALVFLGKAIYKECKKLQMNPWLWLIVVYFVPNGIGLLLFLLFRSNEVKKLRCPSCSKPVKPDYVNCPECGYQLSDSCSKCQKAVQKEWKLCPYCGNEVTK